MTADKIGVLNTPKEAGQRNDAESMFEDERPRSKGKPCRRYLHIRRSNRNILLAALLMCPHPSSAYKLITPVSKTENARKSSPNAP